MPCNHDCSRCSGCAGTLELTEAEMELLQQLGQFSFLPVARRADDMNPVYLEDDAHTREEYSLIIQCLEKKGLVDVDYRAPLKGYDMGVYRGYPVHGTIALTQRGQTVVEMLEIQGID